MGTDNYFEIGSNVTLNFDNIVWGSTNQTISNKKDIQLFISDGAIIAKDTSMDRKAVVKKCDLDEYDLEKGVLYALAKMHGFTAKDIQRLIDNAKDVRKKEHD